MGDFSVTTLIEVQIEDWIGKARCGGPTGPDDDDSYTLGSAGVIEFREVQGQVRKPAQPCD